MSMWMWNTILEYCIPVGLHQLLVMDAWLGSECGIRGTFRGSHSFD